MPSQATGLRWSWHRPGSRILSISGEASHGVPGSTHFKNSLFCDMTRVDNCEIATALGLSEKTVRNHITRVFDKIQVQHRYQAIVRARDAGLGTRAGAR